MLDESSSCAAVDSAACALYELFASIAPIPGGADLRLPSGLALSPANAAMCTRDGKRLATFMRGLRDALSRFDRAEVVYAGTGPFAPIAFPFLGMRNVHFTLLDIHETSVQSVRTLIEHFGFNATLLAADATRYRHPRPIDIAIAEVMQKALAAEPQVEIVRNLAAQLSAEGIVIPQSVEIDLMIGNQRAGRIVELQNGVLSTHAVTIPGTGMASYRTTVRTYGRHVLRELESGLTHPEIVWDLHDLRPGERIAFSYETGARPGISYC